MLWETIFKQLTYRSAVSNFISFDEPKRENEYRNSMGTYLNKQWTIYSTDPVYTGNDHCTRYSTVIAQNALLKIRFCPRFNEDVPQKCHKNTISKKSRFT